MSGHYPTLAQAANDYIDIQRGRGGLISIVQFDDYSRILYERGTRNIGSTEGYTGGGTNFVAALQVVIPLVSRTPAGYECRIVFFTDGGASIPHAELQQLRSLGIRMDVAGFGDVDRSVLQQLVTCGGQVTIGSTMNDIITAFRAIAAAD
jgi:hypothetical protein